MNFRAHLTAGAATGTALGSVAFLTGSVDTIERAAAAGGLCAVFALLPDLDTASRPQRWFYRGAALLLAALVALERTHEAALIALMAILPLVHHHRGWTHRWWAAPLVPLAGLLIWAGTVEGLYAMPLADPVALARAAGALVWSHLPFYLAMVTGYAVHLIVDGRPRFIPRFLAGRGAR